MAVAILTSKKYVAAFIAEMRNVHRGCRIAGKKLDDGSLKVLHGLNMETRETHQEPTESELKMIDDSIENQVRAYQEKNPDADYEEVHQQQQELMAQ